MRCGAGRCLLVWMWFLAGPVHAGPVEYIYDPEIPQVAFAVQNIKRALMERGDPPAGEKDGVRIRVRIMPTGKKPESYAIRHQRGQVEIQAEDAAGAMYGGLEVAELIRIGELDRVTTLEHSPYLAMRGIKFNIPLDVRTPSYTDPCDAAQQNIPEMWSFDFWKQFIDSMATYRYNMVSLWNLHPFPSMVKVPDYPGVALEDVQRSAGTWKEYYSLNGTGFDAPEILDRVDVVKRMTMAEKIAFWRKVMRYGKERNIDFYVVTWNTFVYGTGGQYGITTDLDNPTTIDYFRKSVAQMFLTYPDLAGVGLTPGENMKTPESGHARSAITEPWLFATYGQGILDAGKQMPERKMTLIHRQHMSAARDIATYFQPVIDQPSLDFLFSFKYAKAHVMSCTTQPYHDEFVEDLEKRPGLRTIWTLRNDDNYYFRWGAPDFVRAFIRQIPYEVSHGFYYGSDQWIWGREFLSRDPDSPRQIEVDKHWYHWMLWGRLGYDPTIGNERFIRILGARFPTVDAKQLFTAWQSASMIYPLTTGFHWGALDFQWYIEGCKSHPQRSGNQSGFHDVNQFIDLPPHPSTGNLSIPEYVKGVTEKAHTAGITPPEVSDKLHGSSDQALAILETLTGDGRELAKTLSDIRCMAYLGKYYGHKIRGATELALYRATKEQMHQHQAVMELTQAADFWKRYLETAMKQYRNPLWTNRVGKVDWVAYYQEALKDIELAKE